MFAKLVLWSWAPIVLIVFAYVKPRRRAALVAYLGAYLFLPMDAIRLNALLELSKFSVAGLSVILGMLLFDRPTLARFRPKWYDLPMLVWCLTPYLTSMENGLGVIDGLSSISIHLVIWGIPYFIGRCYFNDWESFRELGLAIVIGGIIYIPFCLLEIKVSPVLHKYIYGRSAHSIVQEKRLGGFRPQVFMFSGLAVGTWMTTASVVAVWMWVTGSVKKLWGLPFVAYLAPLIVTTILCKSGAALGFLFVALACLYWIKYLRNPLPLIVLMLIPVVYMFQRTTLNWDGEWMKDQAYNWFGEERGKSFATRIDAENLLTARAFEAPSAWIGWGKWDKDRPGYTPWRIQTERVMHTQLGDEYIRLLDQAPTDGLWVITLGQFGLVGLTALTMVVLLPPVVLFIRAPMQLWDHPLVGAAAAMSIMVALHMSDNLLNGIPNPFYQISMGGLCGIMPSLRELVRQHQAQAAMAAAQGVAGPAPAVVIPQMPPTRVAPVRGQPAPTGIKGFPSIPGLRAPSGPFRG